MSDRNRRRNESAANLEPDRDRDGRGDLTGQPTDRGMTGAGATSRDAMSGMDERDMTGDELRVPVAEERLTVDKRQAELGEVRLHKTVVEEQQTIPVDLMREEVTVQQRDIADRPAQAGDNLFQGGTIQVPVRGEEAFVTKEAVVTGEVVVDKERTTEREQITDTLRRERVEVDEHDERARAGSAGRFEQGRAAAPPATGPTQRQTSREAEPQPRQSSGAGEGWEQLREQVREDSKR